ncbi:hypothetical protein GCM10010464_77390 [Pseudonocardia yunnanensis]|uniref:Uncharacterized protein n=1 Tax=Pseudonocardia yunnanensis TaxID=58107 RepID=A0ABW4EWC0_9PSEU
MDAGGSAEVAVGAPHRLSITVLTVDVPAVHLLVTDPGKTDGERAPGY